MIGHGWFEIPEVQTGERKLSERVKPLRPLLRVAKGASVLDLGCAEGLIGKWLADEGGARIIHGIDKHAPFLEVARKIMPARRYKAKFDVCDFDEWATAKAGLGLRDSYDIVLALNVIQKLAKPRAFLLDVAALAGQVFVYSGPTRVLKDARSDNKPVNIEDALKKDFLLTYYDPGSKDPARGHLGVRMIFRRRKGF